MTGELERNGIGMAAHDGGIRAGELARRLGQARLAADDAGTLGSERHFELGFPAMARRQPVTARLNGSVGLSLPKLLPLKLEMS